MTNLFHVSGIFIQIRIALGMVLIWIDVVIDIYDDVIVVNCGSETIFTFDVSTRLPSRIKLHFVHVVWVFCMILFMPIRLVIDSLDFSELSSGHKLLTLIHNNFFVLNWR